MKTFGEIAGSEHGVMRVLRDGPAWSGEIREELERRTGREIKLSTVRGWIGGARRWGAVRVAKKEGNRTYFELTAKGLMSGEKVPLMVQYQLAHGAEQIEAWWEAMHWWNSIAEQEQGTQSDEAAALIRAARAGVRATLPAMAFTYAERAVSLLREEEFEQELIVALRLGALAAGEAKKFEVAREWYDEILNMLRKTEDPELAPICAETILNLGTLANSEGLHEEAVGYWDQALSLAVGVGAYDIAEEARTMLGRSDDSGFVAVVELSEQSG